MCVCASGGSIYTRTTYVHVYVVCVRFHTGVFFSPAKPSDSRARARETRNVAKSSLDLINVAEIEVANGRQHKKEDR